MPHDPEPGLNVLLVEDNEIDIEITRRVLAKAIIIVDLQVARDGNEALDLLLQGKRGPDSPRLILLDLRLPVIDGLVVLSRIKGDPDLCVIPVAVLTGVSGEWAMLHSLELGTNMYFVKPLTESDTASLLPAVRKYWNVMERLQGKPGG